MLSIDKNFKFLFKTYAFLQRPSEFKVSVSNVPWSDLVSRELYFFV